MIIEKLKWQELGPMRNWLDKLWYRCGEGKDFCLRCSERSDCWEFYRKVVLILTEIELEKKYPDKGSKEGKNVC